MSDKNIWLPIQGYKHDGSFHRYWSRNFLIDITEDFFIVVSKKTRVVEANGRYWYSREPAVSFFHRRQWWNAIGMIKPEGISFYVNIASPALLDQNIIKYIDYDVDLKMYPNGEIRLLDEREYARHARQFEYGEKIEEIIRFTIADLMKKIQKNDFPFSSEVVQNYYDAFSELTNTKQ
ncbi:MAG: DUF402 domain-containing protein [Bacilli bacterium]|jgi:hypothetical protein|nr:DUF402 domain-containing protein [Bacilli bacterium]MDD3389007.1 DUF402 domain-containing protein [Bacilli bacterium]MDD4344446.1 DUF402 domain-containing protein [Bacilli bacterium]MDD4520650.1 DUF402 domain-containing protein [Bacilli bacterium]MDY0399375.1 DUF402 domain-containing protein [Bacilli bacterium]